MSRFSGTGTEERYHRPSIAARNKIARALRLMIQDSDRFMADMDRFAGWWAGRTGRVTTQVDPEEANRGDSRYHLTLEDVFEIGRFLEMDETTTLGVLAECLQHEAGLPKRRPLSEAELEALDEDIRQLGERVAERLREREREHDAK